VFARGQEHITFEQFLQGLSDTLKGSHATRAQCTLTLYKPASWDLFSTCVGHVWQLALTQPPITVAFKGYDMEEQGWLSRASVRRILAVGSERDWVRDQGDFASQGVAQCIGAL
jgi:hypothetical protein